MRNVAFSVVVLLFLCGPGLLFASVQAGVAVPEALTSKPAQNLSGGIVEAHVGDHLSIEGFAARQLQAELENEVGNCIPAKANAIIANAALQRGSIAASNALFNWDCYPTYFNSGRLRLPDDTLTYLPTHKNSAAEGRWRSFADGLAKVAQRHPDKRFILYVVGAYGEPAYNPAYGLVSDPLVPKDCVATVESQLEDVPNVTVLTKEYDSAESYYEDFFRTDHHWNIKGSLSAYGQIVDELGLRKVDAGKMVDIPDYWYTGATARWGIDLLKERVFDCEYDFSELSVKLFDGSVVPGNDHSSFWDAPPLRKPYAFYDSYYDNLGNATISGGVGDRSALLVSNSYRGAIQRPLAWSYHQLTVNAQLHPATPVVETLEEQINAADADDVIIVGNPSALNLEEAYWE